jgi:hypothetical protein
MGRYGKDGEPARTLAPISDGPDERVHSASARLRGLPDGRRADTITGCARARPGYPT